MVKTGDHTLIGERTCQFLFNTHYNCLFLQGQIAALTGGETGNKSPLAVEMYISSQLVSLTFHSSLACITVVTSS